MAYKVSDFAEGDLNLTAVMETINAACKGFHKLSLTNFDTTLEPQIAAGSVIEVNGALYVFEENESISGSPLTGTVYIMLVPAADSNDESYVYAEYTNTAPTWSDSKQGWYDAGGNYRYIPFKMIKLSSFWYDKRFINFEFENEELNRVNSYDVRGATGDGGSLAIASIEADTNTIEYYEFYLKKPCSCFLMWDQTAAGGSATSTERVASLDIRQYGAYRKITDYDGGTWIAVTGPSGSGAYMSPSVITLNPGRYRIGTRGFLSGGSPEIITVYLYASGIFGLESLDALNLSEIVEVD